MRNYGKFITLHIVPYEELHYIPDAKLLSALLLYEKLNAHLQEEIPRDEVLQKSTPAQVDVVELETISNNNITTNKRWKVEKFITTSIVIAVVIVAAVIY